MPNIYQLLRLKSLKVEVNLRQLGKKTRQKMVKCPEVVVNGSLTQTTCFPKRLHILSAFSISRRLVYWSLGLLGDQITSAQKRPVPEAKRK